MDKEIIQQVDDLYRDHDRLVLDAMHRIARKSETPEVDSPAVEFWKQRVIDCQTALDYANRQLERLE